MPPFGGSRPQPCPVLFDVFADGCDLQLHDTGQVHVRSCSRADEIAERSFACPKSCVGQATAEKFVPQPHAIRVDDVGFTIVGNLRDLPLDKVLVDLTAVDATWFSWQTQDPADLVQ